ncbi:DNA-directed DNA-polymerase family B [Cronobacter phage vB_Cdu_VP8]|nr:DNA-directed DNA-polymerase family B [Cronobacter phage vB_Cdu_VP8]
MEYFLSVEQLGDTIHERYIDENGKERTREIRYQPTLFHHVMPGQVTPYKDIYGKYCQSKNFASIKEAKEWRRTMNDTGLEVLGMDDFKLAYISDTYGSNIVYDRRLIRVANMDIEVTAPEFPNPLEAKYEIDAITHYDSIDDKFYVFDLIHSGQGTVDEWCIRKAAKAESEGGDEVPQELLDKVVYMPFDSEKELLLNYVQLWHEKPPVIFTGWNVEGFDIPYIIRRIETVCGKSVVNRMSPLGKINSKIVTNLYGEKIVYDILGVSILDYMQLYVKFSFTTLASMRLDYVAEHELGVGKLEYDGPIGKLRAANHQRYISYNIIDVARVQQIDDRRQFIELALSLAYYARIPFKAVFSPIKTWDAIIFNSLKEQKRVIPEAKQHVKQQYPGAFVKEPKPGAYRWIISADLTSLYPSIIRQVGISPETIVGSFPLAPMEDYIAGTAPRPSDVYSCSPNGWMYDKSIDGVIPVEITKVFLQRKGQKKIMLTCDRNAELVKEAMHNIRGNLDEIDVDVNTDFPEEVKSKLHELSKTALVALLDKCERGSMAADTAQQNRKILINSLYGALGNIHFRYYDLRNASAITLFGQLALQWIERNVNEYMNKVCGTTNETFVMYGDTDSIYIHMDKLVERVGGEGKFRDTTQIVDFFDKFAKEKLEPAIDKAFRELCVYMNNKEHLMFMDREVIAGPPLGSDGIGGFWTAKKRYALNVWDNEGTRYADPKLKIMGLETQRSSTPQAVRKALKECIRRMLQEGESSLQAYYQEFERKFPELPYIDIASVSSANNIAKYSDSMGYPIKGCPKHIKGVLAYNRFVNNYEGIDQIREGEKVMMLPLMDRNPLMEASISWPSGLKMPKELEDALIPYIDFYTLFKKTFQSPLDSITEFAPLDYEKKASLTDLFDI